MSFAASPAVLTYFNGQGLAETPRFLLTFAGVPFVSKDFAVAADFTALKASGKLAFNQVRRILQYLYWCSLWFT